MTNHPLVSEKTHFLKAGASFRYSDAWKREFEADDDGSSSAFRSKILRSGRFGVGALAAFLLDDEIQVSTRHVSAASGIRFKTRLDPEPVELRHDPSLKVGTTIRIHVSPSVQTTLKKESYTTRIPGSFDWFSLDKPIVRRVYGKRQRLLETKYSIRLPDSGTPSRWRKLAGIEDYDVYWSYSDAPALSCNGLYVSNSTTIQRFNSIPSEDTYYAVGHPNICVLDPDGNLPLTLQRDALSIRAYPFEQQLLESIIMDFFGFLLIHTPENPTLHAWLQLPSYRGIGGKQSSMFYGKSSLGSLDYGQTVFTRKGISVYDPTLIKRLGIRNALYLFSTAVCSREVQQHDCVYLRRGEPNPLFIAYLLNGLSDPSTGFASPEPKGVRVLLRKQTAHQILDYQSPEHAALGESQGAVDKRKLLKAKLQTEWTEHGWVLLKTQDCPESLCQFVGLERKQSPEIAAVEVFFSKPVEGGDKSSLLGIYWNSVFDHPFIPFDIKERGNYLTSAYEKLKYFIDLYRTPNPRLPT